MILAVTFAAPFTRSYTQFNGLLRCVSRFGYVTVWFGLRLRSHVRLDCSLRYVYVYCLYVYCVAFTRSFRTLIARFVATFATTARVRWLRLHVHHAFYVATHVRLRFRVCYTLRLRYPARLRLLRSTTVHRSTHRTFYVLLTLLFCHGLVTVVRLRLVPVGLVCTRYVTAFGLFTCVVVTTPAGLVTFVVFYRVWFTFTPVRLRITPPRVRCCVRIYVYPHAFAYLHHTAVTHGWLHTRLRYLPDSPTPRSTALRGSCLRLLRFGYVYWFTGLV